MAEILDFTLYPLTGEAWKYLTARGKNRPPFRYFVRWQELVYLASSLGKQLTIEEITALIQEDTFMMCCLHENGSRTFMGVRRLVTLSQEKRIVDPKPLDGVPKSLWPFIKTLQDGFPVVFGTVGIVRNRNASKFVTAPLCGAPLFLMKSNNGSNMPIETFDRSTHLGIFLRRFGHGLRNVYIWNDARTVVRRYNKRCIARITNGRAHA